MRRIRISTWVLTAIFVAALVAYVLVKPSSASTVGTPVQHKSPAGRRRRRGSRCMVSAPAAAPVRRRRPRRPRARGRPRARSRRPRRPRLRRHHPARPRRRHQGRPLPRRQRRRADRFAAEPMINSTLDTNGDFPARNGSLSIPVGSRVAPDGRPALGVSLRRGGRRRPGARQSLGRPGAPWARARVPR